MKTYALKFRTLVAVVLAMVMMSLPVCAEGTTNPNARFNNVGEVSVTIAFDKNNVVYCGLTATMYSNGSGISGLMKLFDSAGTCLEIWSVSDYEKPIGEENTYQGKYGETYTVTFAGYAYSNDGTPADRLELSVTGTCKD